MFGFVINCKVLLGEYLLTDHPEEDDEISISKETRSLILSLLADQCDCVQHKHKHFPGRVQSPLISDKMLGRRKSYIRVSSPDQCGRNI